MSWADIPDWLRELVVVRDGRACRYCRMAQQGQGARLHIDHIWPQCRDGPTEADNLAVQCINCSLRKSTKVMAVDPLTGRSVDLFHPLRQRWDDHFALGSDGRDAIGRATVEALAMNEQIPREAREWQVRLGLIAPTPDPSAAED